MTKILIAMLLSISHVHAIADRYGVDESMAEGEASVGAIALVIGIFAYLHFKK